MLRWSGFIAANRLLGTVLSLALALVQQNVAHELFCFNINTNGGGDYE